MGNKSSRSKTPKTNKVVVSNNVPPHSPPSYSTLCGVVDEINIKPADMIKHDECIEDIEIVDIPEENCNKNFDNTRSSFINYINNIVKDIDMCVLDTLLLGEECIEKNKAKERMMISPYHPYIKRLANKRFIDNEGINSNFKYVYDTTVSIVQQYMNNKPILPNTVICQYSDFYHIKSITNDHYWIINMYMCIYMVYKRYKQGWDDGGEYKKLFGKIKEIALGNIVETEIFSETDTVDSNVLRFSNTKSDSLLLVFCLYDRY